MLLFKIFIEYILIKICLLNLSIFLLLVNPSGNSHVCSNTQLYRQRRLCCVYCKERRGGTGMILRRCGHEYHAGCIVFKVKSDLNRPQSQMTCLACAIPIHWRELRAIWVVLYHPHSYSRLKLTANEKLRKKRLERVIEEGRRNEA